MFYNIGTYIIPKKVAQTDGVISSFTMWVQCLFHAFKCGQHLKEFEGEFVFGQVGPHKVKRNAFQMLAPGVQST